MSRETIFSRIKKLCERDNIDLSSCREDLGINALHNPTVDDIIKLSQYFDCTTDYLITGEEISNRQKQANLCVILCDEGLQQLRGEKGKVDVETQTVIKVDSEPYVWTCEITARPVEEMNKKDQELLQSTTIIDNIMIDIED